MAKFKTIITTAGAAKIAAVLAGTASIVLDNTAKMAVGDGGGTLPTPNPAQTKLVKEVHRAPINRASIDTSDPKNIVAELVIPPETGGFWLREMALYDAAGTLLAVGNMAETYKPSLSEGAGRKMVIRMVIAVSEVNAITITMDTSTVMAAQDYVDGEIDKHAKSRNHPDATLTAKGFTQLSSSTTSASETLAATPKAVKTVMDATNLKAPLASPALTGTPTAPTAPQTVSSTQIATTAFVKAAIDALINSSPGALDTLSELAAALGNDPNFATTMVNALAAKAPLASPVLTGTPTAPTAAQTVSNAQIATTAYVKAAIDAVVNASPGALDTLSELAAALGNDPNFATTMVNALAAKAPLANPALTGKPTAPTAPQASNDTQLATTEFVTRAVAPALMMRGNLPNNANLNNYGPVPDFIGIWSFGVAGATVANGFPEDGAQGIFEVFSGGPYQGSQRFTNKNGNSYTRTLTGSWNGTSGPWGAWNLVGAQPNASYVTDLDTMQTAGLFPCRSATLNKPAGVTQGGWVFVTTHVAAGNVLQIYHTATVTAGQENRRYTRTFNGTVWSAWKIVGTDALNDLGYGLTASSRITSFDWQQADFLTGSMQTFVFSSSLNPPSGVSYNTNTTVTATTIQRNSNAAVIKLNSLSASNGDRSEYIIVVTGAAGSRSFNVVRSYNSDSSTVIPLTNGGLGATTPAGGRKTLGFDDLGIGISAQLSAASFDWQQVDFVTGQRRMAAIGAMTNVPVGLNYSTSTTVSVECLLAMADRFIVRITSGSVNPGQRAEYIVAVVGAKGSRALNILQTWNGDSIVPVGNGGTGGRTPTEAQTNLQLVKQANSQDGTTGRLITVGGFGLGTKSPAKIALDNMNPGGFYVAPALLGGLDDNVAAVSIPYDDNTGYQLLIPPIPTASPKIYFRQQSTTPAQNGRLCMVYTDTNTTKAADGTLKAASPIVKLFADGHTETNEESEGCTVTRLGVGEYLIQGCIGLNADAAWGGVDGGFDIPKDRNRQPLVWLDYEVNPDGSVLVKTYHRTFPDSPAFARNEREGFADGDPIDIPSDQFVSVRVEMPADSVYNLALNAAIEQAAIDAAIAKAAREQEAREQAEREAAEREQAALEEAARQQAERDEAAQQRAAEEEAIRQQAAREEAERQQAEEEAARIQAELEEEARQQAELQQSAAEQYPDEDPEH